jgi:anti-anti-sigma factor
MNITTVAKDDRTIVQFEGKLDTNTAPQAQGALDQLMADDVNKILVDFTNLDYVSSAGLRVLLSTAKTLKRKKGAMGVYGLNETVQEIFDISGFSFILKVYANEAEATAKMG